MQQVISPAQFKTIPWKNGLGETTELAINDGGNLDSFDWRISIASVVNDGVFSDFSGYQRNLVLISGAGITLQHVNKDGNISNDHLTHLLDLASFDGACKTKGKLTTGRIKDFNIITNKEKIMPQVSCYVKAQQVAVNVAQASIYFAYSLTGVMNVEIDGQENTFVPQGSLLKIFLIKQADVKDELSVDISGENMILIALQPRENDTYE